MDEYDIVGCVLYDPFELVGKRTEAARLNFVDRVSVEDVGYEFAVFRFVLATDISVRALNFNFVLGLVGANEFFDHRVHLLFGERADAALIIVKRQGFFEDVERYFAKFRYIATVKANNIGIFFKLHNATSVKNFLIY